jgi:hypothetical protein
LYRKPIAADADPCAKSTPPPLKKTRRGVEKMPRDALHKSAEIGAKNARADEEKPCLRAKLWAY